MAGTSQDKPGHDARDPEAQPEKGGPTANAVRAKNAAACDAPRALYSSNRSLIPVDFSGAIDASGFCAGRPSRGSG